MIAEIGNFCLTLAFVLSVAQAGVAAAGWRWRGIERYTEGLSLGAAVSVGLAFAMLVTAFVRSDFSVLNVYQHSHTDKPLLYKITGSWGSHEGSMLLWCLILLAYGAFITLRGGGLSPILRHTALGVQGLLGAAFTGFTLFSSNPLWRLAEDPNRVWMLESAPLQGLSLNPALQDPALAFHPPLLYLGYVGLSVVFSFAVAALITGRLDRAWARWVRPWVLFAWSCLTVGITLGAYWAYYELGWGGWWAWDPVENASFMPWLAATALLHSAIVMEKRDALKAWTVFLGLLAFTFSMLGAFLVRSGLLTSVHAFAVDPQRGILLLTILMVTAGAGFALFALRAPELKAGGLFAPVSREAALVVNNLLLSASLCSVFLGTLYPILVQALFDKTMSVGAPYYILVFGPIMIAALLLVPISMLMAWKRAYLKGVVQRLALAAGVALLAAAAALLIYGEGSWWRQAQFFVGLLVGFWLVFGSIKLQFERAGKGWQRLFTLPLATCGMILAHIGLGVFVLGAVVETHAKLNATQVMAVGDTLKLGQYDLSFEDVFAVEASNYDAQGGVFQIREQGKPVCEARPQWRYYPAAKSGQSEVWLCFTPLSDLYLVMAQPQSLPDGRRAWHVRFYYNPWVRLIFVGPFLMALGGVLSLFDRRLRLGVAVRKAVKA